MVLASCTSKGESPAQIKPNVILLMIDTLRADALGTYGAGDAASPELDAIARRGVVFEKVISQASWTRPSVASIITATYPRKLGLMKEEWDTLGAESHTLAEVFKENGYYTLGLTANPQLNTVFGFSQGFDRYFDSTVIFSWMREEQGKVKADRNTRVKMADELFSQAKDELAAPRDQPFYLQLMVMDVHAHNRIKTEQIDPDLAAHPNPKYHQSVRNVSRSIGTFLSSLENSADARLRNTLVIITSDHGEGLSDHPGIKNSRGHGNLLYRSHIHIPLIIFGWGDSALSPHQVSQTIEALDIFPTALALSGITPSAELDGQSLKQAIFYGSRLDDSRPAFTETQWHPNVSKAAVVRNDWLYIENRDEWPGTSKQELQPLWHTQNGVDTSQVEQESGIAEEMVKLLKSWESRFSKSLQTPKAQGSPGVSSEEIHQLKSLGYLN